MQYADGSGKLAHYRQQIAALRATRHNLNMLRQQAGKAGDSHQATDASGTLETLVSQQQQALNADNTTLEQDSNTDFTSIDAATFTFVRIFSGAAALWLIIKMRRTPWKDAGNWTKPRN